MADAQTSSKKGGLTRGKAILIAVLALVLGAILYIQFGSSGANASSKIAGNRPPRQPAAAPQSAEEAAKPAAATDAKLPPGKDVTAALTIDETRWKPPELAVVTAFDPFVLPAAFPQLSKVTADGKSAGATGLIAAAAADDAKKLAENLAKLQKQLQELKQRGVHVIFRDGNQYAAMIDQQTLHVGDEINGFTVTGIDPNGVHVERKKSHD